MALERELQKRERILRQLVLLNHAGQGLGVDLMDKLREERNLLPVYRRRTQDLLLQVQEKDAEIKRLKRDPYFTRIIELQVEFASWQHEARRLQGLLQEPSMEVNEAAKKEVEVHALRVQRLEAELQSAEEQKKSVLSDLTETETDHAAWLQAYQERERDLTREQDSTRDAALSFKELLQKRKEVEQLQGEIEEMALRRKRTERELEDAALRAVLLLIAHTSGTLTSSEQ